METAEMTTHNDGFNRVRTGGRNEPLKIHQKVVPLRKILLYFFKVVPGPSNIQNKKKFYLEITLF